MSSHKTKKDVFVANLEPPVDKQLRQSACKIAGESWKKSASLKDFSVSLQKDFEAVHGSGWHIIVGKDYVVEIRYRKGSLLILFNRAANIRLLIFKACKGQYLSTQPDSSIEEVVDFNSRSYHIVSSSMSEHMEKWVTQKCILLNDKYREDVDVAKAIKECLTHKYGLTWQVIFSKTSDLSCCPCEGSKDLLDLRIGKRHVIMFKHSGLKYDETLDLIKLGRKAIYILMFICAAIYGYFQLTCKSLCNEEKDVLKESSCLRTAEEKISQETCLYYKHLFLFGIVFFFVLQLSLKFTFPAHKKRF